MPNIDASRLSAIFKSLSSLEALKTPVTGRKPGEVAAQSSPALTIQKVVPKDKEALKKSLRIELHKLKQQRGDFEKKAPLVAIKEIILWEFGEDIINHPDFNHFTQVVTEQVAKNQDLIAYLTTLISSYNDD